MYKTRINVRIKCAFNALMRAKMKEKWREKRIIVTRV